MDQSESLPVRERGLKHVSKVWHVGPMFVAPRAGAWIEAQHAAHKFLRAWVAPRAGAWIEAR